MGNIRLADGTLISFYLTEPSSVWCDLFHLLSESDEFINFGDKRAFYDDLEHLYILEYDRFSERNEQEIKKLIENLVVEIDGKDPCGMTRFNMKMVVSYKF